MLNISINVNVLVNTLTPLYTYITDSPMYLNTYTVYKQSKIYILTDLINKVKYIY